MKRTYRIAEISFGKSKADCAYSFEYKGHVFEVQRFGANLSIPYFKELIVQYRNQVDAFAISDLPPVLRVGGHAYTHRQTLEIMNMPSSAPLCNGSRVRELSTINGLSKAIESGAIDPSKGIFFPLGLLNLEAIYQLAPTWRDRIRVGDLFSISSLPITMKPDKSLEFLAKLSMSLVNMRDISAQTPMAISQLKQKARALMTAQVKDLHYVYSDINVIQLFGNDLSFLKGKTLITPWNHPTLEKATELFQPEGIINLFPEELRLSPFISYPVLDATLRLANEKTAALSLEEWQSLLSTSIEIGAATKRFVMGARPSVQSKALTQIQKVHSKLTNEKAPDFAFIVHCLSNRDLFRVPGLTALKNAPQPVKNAIEKQAAKVPGFTLGHVKHIVSEKTGKEINGVIYALLATPKLMLAEEPHVTYRKIETLCHHAAGLGAKIIGLGAYTKVVGDSGETVNRHSPIPVTTGNSLSSAATLWALEEAVAKMDILKKDHTGRYDATAMVIGATGSIGKVSAKVLSRQYKRLILVAPRLNRLADLAEDLKEIDPACTIVYSNNANEYAALSDVVVTATSAFDQKIVDVDLLKPGAVVCDCSRPLDFSIDDAMKRPDVLIIESGEVILPQAKITCDLGLPGDIVYACLGETALLAMDGLFEPFTIGRNIDWKKVVRIREMAEEHGIKLAAIRGHQGFITDREIALVRELAMKRRQASNVDLDLRTITPG